MDQPKLIITEDGSHSLFVPALKETYHSFHGALQESRHVFIDKGLNDWMATNIKTPIRILEVGLGTGLNILLAAEWGNHHNIQVEITSLEAYPINADIVSKLNYPQLLGDKLAAEWFSKIHNTPWNELNEIHSCLKLTKIDKKLEDVVLPNNTFDIIFFDAFAPNKQAELWEAEILEKIYNAQSPKSHFVTYCAKGQLKRDLKSLGYQVETLDGPPGKKEMVRGIKH